MKKYILFIVIVLLSAHKLLAQNYAADTLIFNLNKPIAFEFLPSGNVIMTHQPGPVKIYNLNNTVVSTFWDFSDSVYFGSEAGVLGICLDPNFVSNRYVYIFYTIASDLSERIVRLTENNNIGTNPFPVFRYTPPNGLGIHESGNVHFGPLGKLFVTIGNRGVDTNSQSLFNPLGKVIRLNSDGTIPTDNPFYDDGNPNTGYDDRIWAYGIRNGFEFCFSPVNDSIYESENGGGLADEVNFIRKGKNYGWPFCEGFCSPYNPLYKNPICVWPNQPLQLPILTGIIVYNGSLMPELNGKLIVASEGDVRDRPNSVMYKCTLGNAPLYDTVVAKDTLIKMGGIVTIKQGSDGFIYATRYTNSNGNGAFLRIKPNPQGIINQSNPDDFGLYQNYPNPFNPLTQISYTIGKNEFVILKIYDVQGKEVQTLVNGPQLAGNYKVSWDASSYPSGVYFYKLTVHQGGSTTGDFTAEKKMVLIK